MNAGGKPKCRRNILKLEKEETKSGTLPILTGFLEKKDDRNGIGGAEPHTITTKGSVNYEQPRICKKPDRPDSREQIVLCRVLPAGRNRAGRNAERHDNRSNAGTGKRRRGALDGKHERPFRRA